MISPNSATAFLVDLEDIDHPSRHQVTTKHPMPSRLNMLSSLRVLTLLTLMSSFVMGENTSGKRVDFANDVRPILSDACFHCHGPDEESREAGLRLDLAEDAMSAIEPGDADASELVARIIETDKDLLMPPPESGKSLTKVQIETLKAWIEQGAAFEEHWAFVAPKRPQVPTDIEADWVKNPIDAFALSRMQSESVFPSPPAPTRTLVRRLCLDLTGLPPEREFSRRWTLRLQEEGDRAYAELVNELLQSHHFGERWARIWLDAARYADSDGYEKDKPRVAWHYRDWVIDSLNHDRPYDDFIIRQIAGDLLPGATQDDMVATGFLRNSMVNEEGGADPEQFRMEAMFDRMDAIGKSVLGLTVQCSQCHTHKYDPIKHDEYYGMFAYLNNTYDAISTVYSDEEMAHRDQALKTIAKLESQIKSEIPDWESKLSQWAKSQGKRELPTWKTPALDFLDSSISGSKFLPQPDGSYLCQSYAPTTFKPEGTGSFNGKQLSGMQLQLLTHPNLPRQGPGRSVDGTWALSEITVEAALSGSPGKKTKLKIKRAVADRSPEVADLKPRYDNRKKDKRITGGIDFAIDGDEKTAWTNEVDSPQSNINQTAWFEFETPFEIPEGQHALVTVYLSQRHGGWNSDDNQTFAIGRFKVSFTENAIPNSDPLPYDVAHVVARAEQEWSGTDREVLFSHWRTTNDEAEELNEKIASVWESHPLGSTQLVLKQLETPRETWLLGRGDFLSKEHQVQPGVPEFLHDLKPSDEPQRLQFARWLVSNESPTTARAVVNRIWQAYFGIGLVETSDDLGTQSAPASHPEILDFLAVELMENNWSLKHVHRLIVNSATYRQSSKLSPKLAERDPYNRLLARGARFRVPAETVRDITLSASGLLDKTVGGRSVYPVAPRFLFTPPVSYGPKTWDEETGAQRYRRALYTFRFRSVPYPMLENFDAVPGNISCVKRSTSNTPMQALTSLNEPVFLECSIALARKTLQEADVTQVADPTFSRIAYAFERCLQRIPSESETAVLKDYLSSQRERLESGELSAGDILAAGKGLDIEALDKNQLAQWSLLCRVILNLDETITRE